ncbi:hypothetical protein DFH27DRAFT_532859 [Peziza echinospora]|nr:hypothetical protein DFH27DRAFT_532859 [Peziza echinospora]
MEASPLTQAHSHVAKAAQLTSSSHPPTPESLKEASTEHQLAADLFAQALDTTNDAEARRTLELLRDHHRKLSQALGDASSLKSNSKLGASWGNNIIHTRSSSPGPGLHGETPTLRRGGSSNSEADFTAQGFPPLPHHGQAPVMSNRLGKSTSSLLVSNLASKRGIPLAQSALAPILSPATTPGSSTRRIGESYQLGQHLNDVQPTTNPLLVLPPDKPQTNLSKSQQRRNPSSRDVAPLPEAGFNRFYTSLESFVSKIGSPLAGSLGFAGMDLGIDVKEPPKDSSPTNDVELIDGSTVPAHSDKDAYNYGYGVSEMVQNLMPKAWWSGQEQVQVKGGGKTKGIFGGSGVARGRGGIGAWQGGNESFYVVPQSKAGQSAPVSYAAIAGRSTSPPQDISEDYSPLRPKKTDLHRRMRGATDAGVGETILETDETGADPENNSKTMEELILENQQLRHLTDTLSRRLHTWEVNARDSRAMLDRSLMLYRNKSGEGGSFGSISGDERGGDKERELQKEANALASKVAQLESELEEATRQLEKERKENERSTKKASYYKEKWDKLKEGARAKELRKQQQDGRSSMSIAGPFGMNMATPGGGSMGASAEA